MIKIRHFALLFVGLLLWTQSAFSQEQLLSKVTVSLKDATLLDILWSIESQTDLKFICATEDGSSLKIKSISKREVAIKEILDEVLNNSGLSYKLLDNIVTISKERSVESKKEEKTTMEQKDNLSVTPAPVQTIAPTPNETTIKGHIQDQAGLALIGVSIIEEGTNNGVSSDLDGDYTITVKDPQNAQLSFVYIGMETITVNVEGRKVINVTMQEISIQLEQVVVTGYGNISRESYTGSAAVVKSQKLEERSISSIDEAIRGNVAGALSSGSGQPGESSSIVLRGFGSMNASNQPLYVVDGVVWDMANVSGNENTSSNPLNTLNPSDIASFTILKDAASASLYGSRGANGVVVITTKKGVSNEKLRVSLSTNNGFSLMSNGPALTNGPQYAELWVEGQMHSLIQSQISQSTSTGVRDALVEQLKYLYADKANYLYADKNYYEWQKLAQADFNAKYQMPTSNGNYIRYDYFCDDMDKLPSSDWMKAISRVAPFSKTTLTLRGGTSYIAYYASMEYMNQQGTIINSELERYALRLKLNSDDKKDFVNWGINVYSSYTMQSGPNAGSSLYNSPHYAATILPSVVPIRLQDGSYNYSFPDNLLNSNHNPLASAQLNVNERPTINLNIIGNVKFNFTPWLTMSSDGSVYYYGYRRKTYYDSHFGTGYTAHGQLTERDVHRRKIANKTTLDFVKEWNNKHSVNATIGVELEDLDYTFTSMTVQGFGDDNSPYISNSSNVSSYNGDGYSYGLFSLISRADYSYKSKYMISGSFRRDYSSMFSPKYRVGNFWSVSGAYDIAKENFMRKYRRSVNSLKIKASYGVNGTLPSDYYYWQDLYPSSRYTNELGAFSTYRFREDLTWEGNNVWNVGLDASFFKNRLDVGIEYYHRISNNLLQDVKVSMTSGYDTMLQNTDAGIDNTGVELSINGTLIQKKNWTWDLSLNVSKIKSVYYGLETEYLDSYQRQIVANGVNVHTWYLRRSGGVNPENGAVMYEAIDENGEPYMTSTVASAPYYGDYQGVPKVLGGLNSSLSYKGFRFDLLFSYGLGHYIYDRTGASLVSNDGATNNSISRSQLDRWTPDNTQSLNPLRINGSALSTRSTRYLVKGDYLKLKNAKLTYTVPQKVVKKAKMSHLSIFVQAENPYILGYIKDYDPEMTASGYRFPDLYPTGSTYTLGLNIRF